MALAIAGCGSSTKNPVDAPVSDAGGDVRTDAGTDAPRDTATDRGNDLGVDRPRVDVAQNICSGVAPSRQVIADFEGLDNSAFGAFGQDPVIGNTYVNAIGLQPEDFGDKTWHLSGIVYGRQDYFGLSWTCIEAPNGGCTLNVSQWAGIQFDIKGSTGPSHNINFTLGRKDNDTGDENAMCGTCVIPADASASTSCQGPRIPVAVPTDITMSRTVVLHWADLVGGTPNASVDPHQLTGILWYFDNPTGTDGGATDAGAGDGGTDGPPPGTPSYNVDFTIDNIQFVPF